MDSFVFGLVVKGTFLDVGPDTAGKIAVLVPDVQDVEVKEVEYVQE